MGRAGAKAARRRPAPVARSWSQKTTTDAVVAAVAELGSNLAAAERLGVSPQVVSYHLGRANRNLIAVRPADDGVLHAAWEQAGGDLAAAAAILGFKPETAGDWFVELGLHKRRGYEWWTEDQKAVVELEYDFHARSNTLALLVAKCGHPLASVHHMAQDLGLADRSRPRDWRRTVSSLSNAQLRDYLAELRNHDGASRDWQRHHGYPDHLIAEIRKRLPSEWEAARKEALERDGTSNTHIGKSFEKQLMSELRAHARRFELKFSLWDNDPSWGAADIVMAGHGRWYAIQADTSTRNLSKQKWDRLYEWAQEQGAVPIYATSRHGSTRYYRLTGLKPEGKRTGLPMQEFDWEQEFSEIASTHAGS